MSTPATPPAPLPAPGHMGVDYEERVDFDRLRDYRIGRAKAALESQRVRRVPALRLLQHPLHDADVDRRRARRQDDPLRAAGPRPGPGAVGLRLRGEPPQAVLAVAGPGANYRAGFLGLRGAVAPTAG